MSKMIDITGQRFGHLTALKIINGSKYSRWLCRCDCGTEVTRAGQRLRNGTKRGKTILAVSCGCVHPMKFIDIAGQRFGHLTAVEVVQRGKYPEWRCKCDCGKEIIRKSIQLKRNDTVRPTCGCIPGQYRHGYAGKTRHPLYRVWSSMHNRCRSPNDASFIDYGGRGIKVCERWHDFANFIADVGERPPRTSLDRINNDGNYEPDNVKWATASEQIKNRRVFQTLDKFSTEELIAELTRRGAL